MIRETYGQAILWLRGAAWRSNDLPALPVVVSSKNVAILAAIFSIWLIVASGPSVSAQQIPAWRKPESKSIQESQLSIRIALKSTFQCAKNVIELQDIADLSGSDAILQSLRNMPLGPAPIRGSRQTWRQDDVLGLLKLRGIDERAIRWAGDEACQVIRMDTLPPDKAVDFTPSDISPQLISLAARNIASVIQGYLKAKSIDATSWTIKPTVSDDFVKILSQKRSIQGVTGGVEPWTGEQVFELLVTTPQGEQSIQVSATINTPKVVCGATGPLAKGRVIGEADLKSVRLTPTMKASPDECFAETDGLIGKELRRSISTGQPILRADVGPVRTIQSRDQVEVRVVSGAIVVQTAGRALHSGGVDEIIEVEIIGSKKRLAARVIQGNLVEAIAR
jgi:flagella basal body P-ring formation protein FlgA